jgi:hypothetical protein
MKFKPQDLLPTNSYSVDFLEESQKYFSKGDTLRLYMPTLDYPSQQSKLRGMSSDYEVILPCLIV